MYYLCVMFAFSFKYISIIEPLHSFLWTVIAAAIQDGLQHNIWSEIATKVPPPHDELELWVLFFF